MRTNLTAAALLAGVAITAVSRSAVAQSAPNCPAMRKINIGVSVAPPNVVHTSPYVAKALGFFAKRCIDANIVQFEGGQSQTSAVAAAQGTAIVSVSDVSIGRGLKVQQIWGLAPRMPQAYMVPERHHSRGRAQGQAAVGDRRRRRRLQLAHGPRGAASRPALTRGRRAVHPLADRRPPARPDRQPDRRRRAASGGRVPRQAAEADAEHAGAARRADAALHVQRLWRVDRMDRPRPRAAARHRRRDDRGQPRDLPREGQGGADHHGGHQEAEGGGRIRLGDATPRTACGRSTPASIPSARNGRSTTASRTATSRRPRSRRSSRCQRQARRGGAWSWPAAG